MRVMPPPVGGAPEWPVEVRRPFGGVVLYEESLVGWAAAQERVESLAAQIEAGTFNPALLLASPGNPSASK